MQPSLPVPINPFACFWPVRAAEKATCHNFIEDVVGRHIPELTAEQAKAANAGMSETDLTFMVDEAIQ